MRTIATIQGHAIVENDEGIVCFGPCKADIDVDGSGPMHGDPDGQHDTSLHHEDKALNADEVRYIVVPPQVINGVIKIVLGCQAWVSYEGREVTAVVGDVGPERKLGEISRACAQALGIPDSPTIGGVASGVTYKLKPGLPALVDNITFTLQPS